MNILCFEKTLFIFGQFTKSEGSLASVVYSGVYSNIWITIDSDYYISMDLQERDDLVWLNACVKRPIASD